MYDSGENQFNQFSPRSDFIVLIDLVAVSFELTTHEADMLVKSRFRFDSGAVSEALDDVDEVIERVRDRLLRRFGSQSTSVKGSP